MEDLSKADLNAVQDALNEVAGRSGFRCVPVSWEDAQRGTVDGALSCWGGNISDVRLWEKNGTLLYTLRSDNWNERLGYVSSADVAVVSGNHVPGGQPFQPLTLRNYLKNFKSYAGYAGAQPEQLWDEEADKLLSIRFQSVFLPIANDETTEFCTDVYNYNTHSDDDPRNTLLLCTAQGTSVQQDGSGAKKLFIHNVDKSGVVHRYWLEAERSKHKVGGAQLETEEEAAAAAARGKATAIHIGTKAMGTRFNVQMLIQLPCKQKKQEANRFCCGASGGLDYLNTYCESGAVPDMCCAPVMDECEPVMYECEGGVPMADSSEDEECSMDMDVAKCSEASSPPPPPPPPSYQSAPCPPCLSAPPPTMSSMLPSGLLGGVSASRLASPPPKPKPALGTSNAARVSRGSEEDTWAGINNKEPSRDPSQHGTITVTLYYTVAGGIPSPADVEACVADLDALYKACPSDKKLVDCSEITAELTVKNMQDIIKKVGDQPYTNKE